MLLLFMSTLSWHTDVGNGDTRVPAVDTQHPVPALCLLTPNRPIMSNPFDSGTRLPCDQNSRAFMVERVAVPVPSVGPCQTTRRLTDRALPWSATRGLNRKSGFCNSL